MDMFDTCSSNLMLSSPASYINPIQAGVPELTIQARGGGQKCLRPPQPPKRVNFDVVVHTYS